jgi:hypothetical protein
MHGKRSHLLLAAAALVAVGLVAGPTAAATPGRCLPGTPTVTHLAGGAPVKATATRVACSVETGFYTGETGIAVTKQGSIWFSAADWEWAMVHSKDNGRTWQREAAGGPQAMPGCFVATSPATCQDSEAAKNGTVADSYLWVDPATGKLFWSKTYGLAVCSSLSMTPDDGMTWQATTMFACPGADYEKIAGGPAPAGGAKPVGYPSVLYGCTNGPAPVFVAGPARACYSSLDGGRSWGFAGAPLPSPLAPGCLHFQEAQVVGPDGTLYLPISCGGDNASALVRVAMSKDEGVTWSYVAVPTGEVGNGAGLIGGVTMSVDRARNLYVVWRGANQKPYLAVSKDQGATWNGPLLVAPRGVTSGGSQTPQVIAQKSGHIAIGYYGWTKDAQHLNGYLTESFNATARTPLLHTGLLNDPRKPLYFPVDSGTLPRNDYLGVAMAPDGTPWVGLVKLLSTKPDSEGYIPSTGFAAHLE